MQKIPTTIITGFLGSGKTTIINHLIDYLQNKGEKVAYVKNEIGEEDLDAKLMRGKNIKATELLNGCICCTLVGPFINSINELVSTYGPDRIIVESAGTADPVSLALMVEDHPLLARDGLIAIIDVENFEGYKDIHDAAKRQAEMTDLIIFNKIERVDIQQKRRVVGYVRELNEYSPIVEALGGKINPELVFGIANHELSNLLQQESSKQHHEIEDQINAFTYESKKVFDKDKLAQSVKDLPKSIFRVKGIVKTNEGLQVINAAYKRVSFSPIPNHLGLVSSNESKLIVIGFKAKDIQSDLAKVFENSTT
ncbi:MAG: GTP-binding protein [Patescibacteria group bacterium]